MNISKNDYKVLLYLYKEECFNEMKSFTIKKLNEETGLSISKLRGTIKSFKMLGLLEEGAVQHNAKTYYITQLGIQKINELM